MAVKKLEESPPAPPGYEIFFKGKIEPGDLYWSLNDQKWKSVDQRIGWLAESFKHPHARPIALLRGDYADAEQQPTDYDNWGEF